MQSFKSAEHETPRNRPGHFVFEVVTGAGKQVGDIDSGDEVGFSTIDSKTFLK